MADKKDKNQVEIDSTKHYSLEEAASLVKKTSTSKFVGSVDIDILLASGSKKQESVVGSVVLPHQFGEPTRVAVIAEGEDQTKAQKAGADKVGYEDLIKEISDGKIDFDILIATNTVMKDLAKLGRILGPRNLMPSPKNETVTSDVVKAVETYKAGKLNFKMSDQSTVRGKVAMVSMSETEIAENIQAYLRTVVDAAKKLGPQPIKKVTISPTMGRGIKIDFSSALAA